METEMLSPLPWRLNVRVDYPDAPKITEVLDADGKPICSNEEFYPPSSPIPAMESIVEAINSSASLKKEIEQLRSTLAFQMKTNASLEKQRAEAIQKVYAAEASRRDEVHARTELILDLARRQHYKIRRLERESANWATVARKFFRLHLNPTTS